MRRMETNHSERTQATKDNASWKLIKRLSGLSLLMFIHYITKPLWGYDIYEPTTGWSLILFVLVIAMSLAIASWCVHTPRGRSFIQWDDEAR